METRQEGNTPFSQLTSDLPLVTFFIVSFLTIMKLSEKLNKDTEQEHLVQVPMPSEQPTTFFYPVSKLMFSLNQFTEW